MFYKLKREYVLRGWNKMAWVVVHRPENSFRKLSREEFQILLLCDGIYDFEKNNISDEMKGVLENLIEKEIVEKCEQGTCLMDDQYYHYYNNRFTRSIFWSITGRCNFYCRHCYMNATEGILGELSHKQAMDLIDQMAECGVLRVDITGGEPLVRKDFWQLIDRILSYKMSIGQIYTNGWLLTDNILDEFEKRNLKPEFSISFDGVGWHDWMRGVIGAEKAALRALSLCKSRGFLTNVEMCVHKGNQLTVPKTVEILSQMGVSALKVSGVFQSDLWKCNNEENDLSFREYINAMIRYIPYFYQEKMPMNILLSEVILLFRNSTAYQIIPIKHGKTEKSKQNVLCGAARYDCYITPEGRLLPCMPMTACKEQEQFPLVQDIGLKQGLNDSFYMNIVDSRVEDLLKANPKCAACEYKYQCGGGCRATALKQEGNLMACDSNKCLLWEEGYVERIRQVTEEAIAKYCTCDESAS